MTGALGSRAMTVRLRSCKMVLLLVGLAALCVLGLAVMEHVTVSNWNIVHSGHKTSEQLGVLNQLFLSDYADYNPRSLPGCSRVSAVNRDLAPKSSSNWTPPLASSLVLVRHRKSSGQSMFWLRHSDQKMVCSDAFCV